MSQGASFLYFNGRFRTFLSAFTGFKSVFATVFAHFQRSKVLPKPYSVHLRASKILSRLHLRNFGVQKYFCAFPDAFLGKICAHIVSHGVFSGKISSHFAPLDAFLGKICAHFASPDVFSGEIYIHVARMERFRPNLARMRLRRACFGAILVFNSKKHNKVRSYDKSTAKCNASFLFTS